MVYPDFPFYENGRALQPRLRQRCHYITINVFVMQAFMFLSGYFSKKPEKSRQIAFKIFLWPYILSIFFFYGVRTLLWGHANLYFDQPPFAMWFMFALFLYKLFQKNYIKVPHFFAITFVLYLVAGCSHS